MGSTQQLDHLQHFVDEVSKVVPIQRYWISKIKQGEKLSNFSTVVNEQTFVNLPFLKGTLKEVVADKGISFTVTNVRGPVEKDQLDFSRRKMIHTYTYYIDIAFEETDVQTFGLSPDMTLSFAAKDAAGNEFTGRNKKIEALRSDIEDGEMNTVILTRNVLSSGNDWYDLRTA